MTPIWPAQFSSLRNCWIFLPLWKTGRVSCNVGTSQRFGFTMVLIYQSKDLNPKKKSVWWKGGNYKIHPFQSEVQEILHPRTTRQHFSWTQSGAVYKKMPSALFRVNVLSSPVSNSWPNLGTDTSYNINTEVVNLTFHGAAPKQLQWSGKSIEQLRL